MREVCGVSGGGEVIITTSDISNNCNKTMLVPNKSVTPGIKMSSTPGYLELSPEKMAALICQKPIGEYYEVEDQPFARGKYAAVRRCRHRQSGQQFAAKFLKKSRRSADLRPEIIHEVAILDACAGSSRIVRLHQVFESQHEMVLLLELAPGGELQMLLDNDEVPEEVQVKKLMKQILDGLIFLHSINVAHLDLKPQNLVLTGEFPQCDVKLCDLGISRYISDGADIRDILGTPDYVAPEVLNYESISLATDMWSVGVLLYVLLTGCSPFGGDTKQETFCNISQCNLDFPDDLFEEISEDAIDLMKKLMVKDPSKRLDARQCLQHRWFTSNEAIARLCLAKTAASSPLPARKQQQLDACQNVATPRASPKLKHKAPVETTVGDKPSDFRVPEIRVEVPSESRTSVSGGMKSSRRDNFKRNLSELAQRLSDANENGGSIDEAKPTTVFLPLDAQRDTSTVATGTMRKAKSMHLLPVDGRFDRVVNNNNNPGEVRRRVPVNRDCLYSFRKCIVIDDEDVSPPMSIAGSVTSSVYSDQSISDSGSEVSELSIDSSSDRSSIISLDDSLDYNAKTGRYVPTATGHHNNNLWSRQRSSLTINDSFASAFMRFSSGMAVTENEAPMAARRPPARGAHTVVLDRGPPTAVNRPSCRVEFRKERFGNVVVIREVRAGKYLQVNELKCESIQARIRRLQVQGIQKT